MKLVTKILLSLICVAQVAASVSTNAPAAELRSSRGESAPSDPGKSQSLLTSAATVPGKPPLQIVTLRKSVDMEGLIQEHGLTPKFRYRALNGFAAPMSEAVIQKLKTDSRVMFVEADGTVAPCDLIETNGFGRLRMGLDHFPPAHINGTPKSLDVDVAVLDTGVDPHEDLPPSYFWFSPFSDNPYDELNHGTAVAGVIAALDNNFQVVGVTPGVRIWNIKIMGPPPENNWVNVVSGMDYIFEPECDCSNRISVANMSFGNLSATSPINTIHYFVKQMVEAGIVVVAAVGNTAQDLAGPDGIFNNVEAGVNSNDDVVPASFPEVMAVSAMDSARDSTNGLSRDVFWVTGTPGLGSNFSQVERTNNFVSSPGGAIDVAAPGVNIATTSIHGTNGFPSTWYAQPTGTSFAAPHVTGLVALYIATHGRATNAAGVYAIRQAIVNAALPQSQWRPHGYAYDSVTNNTGDPDTHPEPLAIAAESLVPPPFITKTAGAPGNYSVQFATVPGYDYTVQTTTNLAPPIQWTNVATRTGSNFVATVSVTDSNAASQSFYRLARRASP